MESPRWNIITPSQYEWERRGLDFIRTGLPDHDPYRAWANFEFQTDDGAIYEVDLLVLTKQGFWLVECKAWGGRIYGDTGTWTRSQDGRLHSEDNPVLLANRKAKALSSLLKAQPALSKIRLPWLDALVFLSADDLQCDLTGNARNRVLLKDRAKTDTRPEQKGILAALINRTGPGIDADLRGAIDIKVANAPPKPFHILAQQLMALILQQRGIGRRAFVEWLADVPAFAAMPSEQIELLVDHLVRTGTLFDDAGILSFGPEGEAEYGRKNFLEILSVFTSPPLFRVISGQKELGNVHESTFYKKQEGPVILVLAGRNWKTNHLDWKRRIAYVEPTDEKGRSRWIGEGQFLGFRVCQAIRRVLAAETTEPYWSQRATAQIGEIRLEYPWASHDRTTLVQQANGEVQWWTFAGGLANSIVMDHLGGGSKAKTDNLCLRFSSTLKLADVEALIASRIRDEIIPVPSQEAIDNLKFGECLPPPIAGEVFFARFNDPEAIANIRQEPMRVVVVGEGNGEA